MGPIGRKQAAPGIIAVSIAPIFCEIAYRLLGAIGSGVLRCDQTIKGIVSEGLGARRIAVIGYPESRSAKARTAGRTRIVKAA